MLDIDHHIVKKLRFFIKNSNFQLNCKLIKKVSKNFQNDFIIDCHIFKANTYILNNLSWNQKYLNRKALLKIKLNNYKKVEYKVW